MGSVPSGSGIPVMRLNSDGSKDNSFTPALTAGPASLTSVQSILVMDDNSIIVGGAFCYRLNGSYYYQLAHLTSNGAIITTFLSPMITSTTVTALAKSSDGKFIVGGRFSIPYTGKTGNTFMKLNPSNAAIDPDFYFSGKLLATVANTGGVGYDVGPDKIVAQPNGKFLIQGQFSSIGLTQADAASYPGAARLNSDGSLDASFHLADDYGGYLCLMTNGNMMFGRSSTLIGEALPAFFSVVDVNGKLTFPLANLGYDKGNITVIVQLSDNEFLLSGEFDAGSKTYGLIKVKQ